MLRRQISGHPIARHWRPAAWRERQANRVPSAAQQAQQAPAESAAAQSAPRRQQAPVREPSGQGSQTARRRKLERSWRGFLFCLGSKGESLAKRLGTASGTPFHHGVTCGIAAPRPVTLSNRLRRFGRTGNGSDNLGERARRYVASLI